MQITQALGVFIRYVPAGSQARSFYQELVGLPLIRSHGTFPADIYWAGEASIFETVEIDGHAPDPQPDPRTASSVPLFRTHDLDAALTRLSRNGLKTIAIEARGLSREAYCIDPTGRLIGLRERSAASNTQQDIEARRRHVRGETFNPGCKQMPEDIQALGWVVRRAADVEKIAAFYETVLGLQRLPVQDDSEDRISFDLGDNVVLELLGGGNVLPAATQRYSNSDALLLRVSNTEALRTRFVEHGGHLVQHRLNIPWGDLAYVSDPEHFVFGIEQNFHPGQFMPGGVILPENIEADRRWRETVAQRRATA